MRQRIGRLREEGLGERDPGEMDRFREERDL